ncbi:MAG: hypothetical protein AB8G14_04615 [Ilumatobacter sp.]
MSGAHRMPVLVGLIATLLLVGVSAGVDAVAPVPVPDQIVEIGGTVGEPLTGLTSDGVVLALDALLGTNGIELDRGDAARSVTVPVPAGLLLGEIRADATIPAGGSGATIVVVIDGAETARITLPDTTSALRIPVSAATGAEAVVTFSLLDDGCGTDVGSSNVLLSNIGFTFAGVPDVPTTIAEFMPAVMTSAVIIEPSVPTDAEREATYSLAAALARRYAVTPSISIIRDSVFEPTRPDPFERVFSISESDSEMLAVTPSGGASVLEITGTAQRLAATAAAPASNELVLLTSAVSDDPPVPAETDIDELTGRRDLLDLGVDDTEQSGAATLEVVIPLPQSAFGEPIARLRLSLTGIASSGVDDASVVSLTVNDRLVDLVEVEANGTFAVDVEISPREMRRDNVVVLRSELAPCDAGVGAHRLVVSTASTVDAAPGQSLAPSLDRFPQVAIVDEGLLVAVGPTALEQQVAATIVAALQTASPFVMQTSAGDVESTVSAARPALVVSGPNEAVIAALRAADTPGADDEFAPGLSAIVALDSDVLAVTLSDVPGATFELLRGVHSSGWAALLGRIVGFDSGGARTVVDAAAPFDVDVPSTDVPSTEDADEPPVSPDVVASSEEPTATAVVVIESGADGAELAEEPSSDDGDAGDVSDEGSSAFEPFVVGLFVTLLVLVAIFAIRSFFRMITGRSIRS